MQTDKNCDFNLPGFYLYRFDSPLSARKRSSYGIAVYSKNKIPQSDFTHKTLQISAKKYMEAVIVNVHTATSSVPALNIATIYSSPGVSWTELRGFLEGVIQVLGENHPSVIVGDFNIDLTDNIDHPLTTIFQSSQQIAEETTDYHSLLDHVYVTCGLQNYSCGVLESHFTDHKGIFCVIQTDPNK